MYVHCSKPSGFTDQNHTVAFLFNTSLMNFSSVLLADQIKSNRFAILEITQLSDLVNFDTCFVAELLRYMRVRYTLSVDRCYCMLVEVFKLTVVMRDKQIKLWNVFVKLKANKSHCSWLHSFAGNACILLGTINRLQTIFLLKVHTGCHTITRKDDKSVDSICQDS